MRRVGVIAGDHFSRAQPRQGFLQPVGGNGLGHQNAGAEINPGQRLITAGFAQRNQKIVLTRGQKIILDQRAGGDDADNLTFKRAFVSAFSGGFGVLGLLTDRDTETLPDQPRKIGFSSMERHPAHRHFSIIDLATARQGDIQRRRCIHRILKEHLIEIPHAIKQQAIGVIFLDRKVLRHHRGNAAGIQCRKAGDDRCILRAGHGCIGAFQIRVLRFTARGTGQAMTAAVRGAPRHG